METKKPSIDDLLGIAKNLFLAEEKFVLAQFEDLKRCLGPLGT